MSEGSERRRILDMLAAGQLTPQEAEELLRSLGSEADADYERARTSAGSRLRPRDAGGEAGTADRRIARALRIVIDAGEDGESHDRIAVTLPLALAKFAGKLIPEEARIKLEEEGIEIAALLDALDQELPEGRLVDIDTTGSDDAGNRARIVIEVV